MITNTSDDLDLDDKTVVVSYKKSKTLYVISPSKIGYKLDLSKTLPRFRDPAKIFQDPRFSRYHSAPLHDHQDNQQIFRSAQGNDTLEIGSCASSQIRGSLQPVCLLLSCYPDNYVMRYMYYHQSVGVISQSFLNLWHLLHSGYKRHKLTWSFTFSL